MKLTEILLDRGGNPNSQTLKPSPTEQYAFDEETPPASQQTPLHLALVHRHSDVVEIFLQHKGERSLVSMIYPLGIIKRQAH